MPFLHQISRLFVELKLEQELFPFLACSTELIQCNKRIKITVFCCHNFNLIFWCFLSINFINFAFFSPFLSSSSFFGGFDLFEKVNFQAVTEVVVSLRTFCLFWFEVSLS